MRKRKIHKNLNCQCASCKSKRGEYNKENHPMFGKHHMKESKEKIRNSDYHKNLKGKNNPNYIDGRKSLGMLIRSLEEYNSWRNKVFKKDNYICQECGQIGGSLEAHHNKAFAELLQEFLREYDQFSPIEDKATLVRLAIKWKPFWNINNGKTLCEDCHNEKHPSMNFR